MRREGEEAEPRLRAEAGAQQHQGGQAEEQEEGRQTEEEDKMLQV